MGGQGGQSLKVLVRALSDFEVFSFSKLNNQNKFFRLKKFYLFTSLPLSTKSSNRPHFTFCYSSRPDNHTLQPNPEKKER
jgi:hypothetical protein